MPRLIGGQRKAASPKKARSTRTEALVEDEEYEVEAILDKRTDLETVRRGGTVVIFAR